MRLDLGSTSGGKALCNIKDGKLRYIREGSSSGGRQMIKNHKFIDAAKAIGTSSLSALNFVWYFFLLDKYS